MAFAQPRSVILMMGQFPPLSERLALHLHRLHRGDWTEVDLALGCRGYEKVSLGFCQFRLR
jgi:hypothetical protein